MHWPAASRPSYSFPSFPFLSYFSLVYSDLILYTSYSLSHSPIFLAVPIFSLRLAPSISRSPHFISHPIFFSFSIYWLLRLPTPGTPLSVIFLFFPSFSICLLRHALTRSCPRRLPLLFPLFPFLSSFFPAVLLLVPSLVPFFLFLSQFFSPPAIHWPAKPHMCIGRYMFCSLPVFCSQSILPFSIYQSLCTYLFSSLILYCMFIFFTFFYPYSVHFCYCVQFHVSFPRYLYSLLCIFHFCVF